MDPLSALNKALEIAQRYRNLDTGRIYSDDVKSDLIKNALVPLVYSESLFVKEKIPQELQAPLYLVVYNIVAKQNIYPLIHGQFSRINKKFNAMGQNANTNIGRAVILPFFVTLLKC